MIRSLMIAASGMDVQQTNMDVISNNLANVNTSGFKRSRGDFQDLLYQTIMPPGAPSSSSTEAPTGMQIGLGSRVVSVNKIFTQGELRQTGNELDIAIEGEGFLQVLLPTGEKAYTRDGAIKKNSTGKLVTPNGYAIEPAITVPDNASFLTIAADGTVSALLSGSTTPTVLGTLQLARFSNPSALRSLGKNLLAATPSSGTAAVGNPGQNGLGTIAQGFLEASNVNIVEEMVSMIVGQRAYEINSKVIQTVDQMLRTATNVR
ncbi:MAG: flagellar basal-body rod protein FlgG [Deltaproteobacteria bacterium]|nr:flagellar basal-body rod protein FlgG [Deltaproteobacteria bacterium]